jgi:hypothetical protein
MEQEALPGGASLRELDETSVEHEETLREQDGTRIEQGEELCEEGSTRGRNEKAGSREGPRPSRDPSRHFKLASDIFKLASTLCKNNGRHFQQRETLRRPDHHEDGELR